MTTLPDITRLCIAARSAIPEDLPDLFAWGEEFFIDPKSTLSSSGFKSSLTPWVKEPGYRAVDMETRITTFIKPVQSGGSAVGELVLLYWIKFWRGLFQYNWSKNSRALDRWKSRVSRLLECCQPVREKLDALGRFDAVNCEVDFGNVYFRMQGVYEDDNLDSDTIPLQINEEVHSWEPGKLQKARNRGTAVWNFKSFDISNAGNKDDQLHKAFEAGSAQRWEVRCPGCSNPHHEANAKYHVMRTRWDDKRPELGGLRYDADGCRRPGGEYDYNRLAPTVRYQMPCGYIAHEDTEERRALSLGGRYGEPTNPGAPRDKSGRYITHRSYSLEAVSVDYIPWIELIQQKHLALRSWKLGDMQPWKVYQRERECVFVDPTERPMAKPLEVTTRVKERSGMPGRLFRFGQLDYQEGEQSELPHWWLSIYDVDKDCNMLVVFEGKCEGDSEAADVLKRHEVIPICVVVDSSFKAKIRVYDFCLKHGYNALKVEGGDKEYKHEDGSVHCWSEPEPLWRRAGRDAPTREDDRDEPEFFLVSDQGSQDLLNHIRAGEGRRFEIPADVSKDYHQHFAAWALEPTRIAATNETKMVWKKAKEKAPDHLYKLAAYAAVQCDMVDLVGSKPETKPEEKATE